MLTHAVSVLLAFLAAPVDEGRELDAFLADAKAVQDVVRFDLASIPDREASQWCVLRIRADESSGDDLLPGYFDGKIGKRIIPKGSRGGMIVKGQWERIGSVVPAPNAKPKGTYDWLDDVAMGRQSGRPDYYYVLYDGGFVLAKHFPDKPGKEQFGRIVVVPEGFATWVPAAYQFRREHPDVFSEPLKEERLVKLLRDENPMIAVMAAQRLAKSKRLTGKALEEALGGPADYRRAVAVSLAHVSRAEMSPEASAQIDAYVAPEIDSAMRRADAKTLRLYALGIFVAQDILGGPGASATTALLKRCRDRAAAIHLDDTLRKELDFVFEVLPPRDAK
jgi:hypothetical protein